MNEISMFDLCHCAHSNYTDHCTLKNIVNYYSFTFQQKKTFENCNPDRIHTYIFIEHAKKQIFQTAEFSSSL